MDKHLRNGKVVSADQADDNLSSGSTTPNTSFTSEENSVGTVEYDVVTTDLAHDSTADPVTTPTADATTIATGSTDSQTDLEDRARALLDDGLPRLSASAQERIATDRAAAAAQRLVNRATSAMNPLPPAAIAQRTADDKIVWARYGKWFEPLIIKSKDHYLAYQKAKLHTLDCQVRLASGTPPLRLRFNPRPTGEVEFDQQLMDLQADTNHKVAALLLHSAEKSLEEAEAKWIAHFETIPAAILSILESNIGNFDLINVDRLTAKIVQTVQSAEVPIKSLPDKEERPSSPASRTRPASPEKQRKKPVQHHDQQSFPSNHNPPVPPSSTSVRRGRGRGGSGRGAGGGGRGASAGFRRGAAAPASGAAPHAVDRGVSDDHSRRPEAIAGGAPAWAHRGRGRGSRGSRGQRGRGGQSGRH